MTKEYATQVLREMQPKFARYDMEHKQAIAIRMAIEALQERKTGKWIHTNSNTFKCSICGNFLDFNGVNAGRGDANYCPNCGEKMEVDE